MTLLKNPVRFNFPTPILFGPGARNAVAEHLKTLGFKRPLIVTDRGLAGLPIFQSFTAQISQGDWAVATFSGIWGNPVKSQVIAGVEAYRVHHADCVIGFGGGAALDVAKAIVLMIHHPGDLFDYEDDKPGGRPFDQEIPYWVALPTASGTGSEVGRSAVVSDEQTHLKKIIFSPRLMARQVFADPELTLDLPASVSASTGMDALTHCVESFLAKGYHPICDGIALEGVRLAAGSLARSVKEPTNLEARSDMMMASMMGAIAFQKGLGVTHSCAHALSTVADLHHGLANGIMIDHALKHNLESCPDRFESLFQAVSGASRNSGARDFLSWLKDLKAQIGIPARLSDVGIKKEQLTKLVDVAVEDVCHSCNPRVCTREDFVRIFDAAY